MMSFQPARPTTVSYLYGSLVANADPLTPALLERAWAVFTETFDSRLANALLASGALSPERSNLAAQAASSRPALVSWATAPHVSPDLIFEILPTAASPLIFRSAALERRDMPLDFYIETFEDDRSSDAALALASNINLPTSTRLWAFSFVVSNAEIPTLMMPLSLSLLPLARLVATFPRPAWAEMSLDNEGVIFALADAFVTTPSFDGLSSAELLVAARPFFTALLPLTSSVNTFARESDLADLLFELFTHPAASAELLNLFVEVLSPLPPPANIYALKQPSLEVFDHLLSAGRTDLIADYIEHSFAFDSFSDRALELLEQAHHRHLAVPFFTSLLPRLAAFEARTGSVARGLRSSLAASPVLSLEVLAPLSAEDLSFFPPATFALLADHLAASFADRDPAWHIFETLVNDGFAPLGPTAFAARHLLPSENPVPPPAD